MSAVTRIKCCQFTFLQTNDLFTLFSCFQVRYWHFYNVTLTLHACKLTGMLGDGLTRSWSISKLTLGDKLDILNKMSQHFEICFWRNITGYSWRDIRIFSSRICENKAGYSFMRCQDVFQLRLKVTKREITEETLGPSLQWCQRQRNKKYLTRRRDIFQPWMQNQNRIFVSRH